MSEIIPIFGMMIGLVIPLAAFFGGTSRVENDGRPFWKSRKPTTTQTGSMKRKANQQTIDVVGLSPFSLASVSMRLEHSQWEDFSRESACSLV